MSMEKNADTTNAMPIKWLLWGVVSHTAWGGYPVLARYLQTVGRIPTLALGGMANGIAFLALLIFVVPKMRRIRPSARDLFIFGVILVLRALTNIYAARFTRAINVQLISLMTPFIVAILSKPLLGERLPRFTALAVCVSILGAVLMVASNPGQNRAGTALTPEDWIGIGLALISAFLLALYMITIRKVVRTDIPAETLVVFQAVVLFLFMNTGSLLIGEDWTIWTRLPASGWTALIVYGMGVILAGSLIQNTALKHIPASSYTMMLAWRLVSTTIFAALILGERFTSVWQALGALIVMATVTLYSWSQNRFAASSGT